MESSNKTHYDSVVMIHPDGSEMCRCSQKKANWYISRGLAVKIDDTTFKLNFEPQGYGNRAQPFYLEIKDNCCVVCGTEENLTKHHVVPYQFRSLFPDELKSHDCHDVLLVCRVCHNKYEREADIFKKTIMLDIGYDIKKFNKIKKHNAQILSARTLLENPEVIQSDKITKLEYYSNMQLIPEPPDWKELFVNIFKTEDVIHEFCVSWRKHFVTHMTPQYISEHFDINHRKNN